jgi:ubiquinone/menaquinone biosynthesis C-methylase UbiE
MIIAFAAVLFCVPSRTIGADQADSTGQDFSALKAAFEEAREGGDYYAAAGIGDQMLEIVAPRHYETLFAIACLHARHGNKPKAYEYLHYAVAAGFWDLQRMRENEDLAEMRDEAYFKELSRTAWSNGYLYMLERPQREEYQEKERVIEALGLAPGECVADIGAGSGYFTIPVAHAVGPDGTVLAIDIHQQMLDFIERRCKAEQLGNVELVMAERDDPMLPPGGVDLVLMVDVFHYIQDRRAYARKIRRGLAPGGRVVVIDFIPKPWEERPWGPPPQQHVPKETLNGDMAAAGLKVVKEYDFISEEYFVVYEAE